MIMCVCETPVSIADQM